MSVDRIQSMLTAQRLHSSCEPFFVVFSDSSTVRAVEHIDWVRFVVLTESRGQKAVLDHIPVEGEALCSHAHACKSE